VDAWEKGKIKLSGKNAIKACLVFANAGIRCSEEWLMTGNNSVPIMTSDVERFMNSKHSALDYSVLHNIDKTTIYDTYMDPVDYKLKIKHLPEDIRSELSFFISFHSSAIFHLVKKESMNGKYRCGDCVAGIEEPLSILDGKTIIAVLENGITILCKLQSHSNANCLVLMDDDPTGNDNNLQEIKIVRAAKIIWHRYGE
jgi:hypothetical protein